jgi:hypothetical protein
MHVARDADGEKKTGEKLTFLGVRWLPREVYGFPGRMRKLVGLLALVRNIG